MSQLLVNAAQLMQNLHSQIEGVKTVVDSFARNWKASEYYVQNRTVRPTTANGVYFVALTEGESGEFEPAWPTEIGEQVVDNEITWEAVTDTDPKGWPITALNPASFPLTLVAEGGAAVWEHEAGDAIQTRSMDVHLFLHPAEAQYYPIARNDSLEYIQRFGNAYTDQTTKVLSAGINSVIIQNFTGAGDITDSGLLVLEYSGEDYYGVIFNVGVRIREAR